MKKIITHTFAAAALAAVSMTGFAADSAEQSPLLLNAAQLDDVDGGRRSRPSSNRATAAASATAHGRRTYTDAYAYTYTRPNKSESYAEATSVTR